MTEIRERNGMVYPMPEQEILLRLGCHIHRVHYEAGQRAEILTLMRRAFLLCAPRGRWTLLAIAQNDGTVLTCEGGFTLQSADFARLAEGATHLWVGAVTVGKAITEAARDAADAYGIVCDAVGSESADSAMDFLHREAVSSLLKNELSLAERRFSPGYGDMALAVQREIFSLLRLEELGMHLNEADYMTPEKSVTAFAAVRRVAG